MFLSAQRFSLMEELRVLRCTRKIWLRNAGYVVAVIGK